MNWETFGPFLVGFAGVVVSAIAAYYTNRSTMKRLDQERESAVAGAADMIVGAAGKQIVLMEGTIGRLEGLIDDLESEQALDRTDVARVIKELLEYIDALVAQIIELGGRPVGKRPKIPKRFMEVL